MLNQVYEHYLMSESEGLKSISVSKDKANQRGSKADVSTS